MAVDIRLSYLYATPEVWEKFELVAELGWPTKTFLQQVCAAYLKVNRAYYVDAALKDARCRGMTEEDYYRILRDQGEEGLPRYVKGTPGLGPSPLVEVNPPPVSAETRHRYNVVTLSNYHAVMLRVARIVENDPMTQLVSRILEQHFEKYWPTNYGPQFDLDRQCKFALKDKS